MLESQRSPPLPVKTHREIVAELGKKKVKNKHLMLSDWIAEGPRAHQQLRPAI